MMVREQRPRQLDGAKVHCVEAPLRNFHLRRLLPDYRFRFRKARKGSFFSILQVFRVLPPKPNLPRKKQSAKSRG